MGILKACLEKQFKNYKKIFYAKGRTMLYVDKDASRYFLLQIMYNSLQNGELLVASHNES